MIIQPPQIEINGKLASLQSRIEFAKPINHVPETAWFRYPVGYADKISGGSEAFAAALIQTAMFFGEDLLVRGQVTPRFAYGLQEYHDAFHSWFPHLFQAIELQFENVLLPAADSKPQAVGMAFSGGIDSTYTLLSSLPESQPLINYRVQYGLLVQGMDYSLDDTEAFALAYTKFQALFAHLGIDVLPVQTNVTAFTKYRVGLGFTFGGPLIAAGLGLGKLFKRYYIASSFTYDQLQPIGSSPVVDPLLGTETMDVIHHGAAVRRFDKLKEVVAWGEARHTLRVCIRDPKPKEHLNCSKCGKCLQVMAQLELMRELDNFPVFQPFELKSFILWGLRDPLSRQTTGELLYQARKAGRWSIYYGMVWVRVSSWLRLRFDRLMRGILRGQRLYRLKRWYFGRERNS